MSGKKTSIYLTSDLAKAIEESGMSPVDLIWHALHAKPRLIQEPEYDRTWFTWWFCDVPDRNDVFKVLDDQWHTASDGTPVRKIYEIEVTRQISDEHADARDAVS